MTKPTHTLFIYGFGYTADHLLPLALQENWHVLATSRSEEKLADLEDRGVHPVRLGDGFSVPADAVPDGAHLLITAPPQNGTCPALADLKHVQERWASITYLSTTGVYGDHDGGWVYETSPVTPQSKRAEARVAAEDAWQAIAEASGASFRTVRLPGIYGPGRSAIDRVKAGTARRIIQPGQVFSRIHVADIASGVMALLKRPELSGAFHLCDDLPAPPQDVIAYAADLLGCPVPPDIPIEDADLSPMGLSFYAECKRVSNTATKAKLGWSPHYPTYKEGLESLLDK